MKTLVRIAMLLGLACTAACGVANGQGSGGIDAADPYVGKVSAQVFAPEGPRDKESGTAGARFVPIGNGRSRLEVQANIRRTNDSGFVIEGSRAGSGWSGRSDGLQIAIDRDGRISGGGIANQHRITFGGRATSERMALTVETEKLAQAAAGDTMPAGTRIVFDYDLGRDAKASVHTGAAVIPAASPPDKKTQKTCKRRVWKMRNVATPGGGMTMTQVPHCLD
jgi:hypothetical protein